MVAVKPVLKKRGIKSSEWVKEDADSGSGTNSDGEYKDKSATKPSSVDISLFPNDANSTGMPQCYDPGPYHQFSAIFPPFILCSQSLVPHSFPYIPLGPPPNHLTSHLMDHLTIPQSDITCHHSAVRSTPQHHHLTLYGLPAHCHVMMELYLELPAHDEPYYT